MHLDTVLLRCGCLALHLKPLGFCILLVDLDLQYDMITHLT